MMKGYAQFLTEAGEMDGLHLLPHQKQHMHNRKFHSLVTMHPRKFLELTTADDHHVDEIKQAAKSLHTYNEYSAAKEIHNPPNLKIGHDGKVTAHEGRHRAAALINAGHERMHVYLQAPFDGKKSDRDHGHADVPHTIHGQHGRGSVKKSELELHQDHVGKLNR